MVIFSFAFLIEQNEWFYSPISSSYNSTGSSIQGSLQVQGKTLHPHTTAVETGHLKPLYPAVLQRWNFGQNGLGKGKTCGVFLCRGDFFFFKREGLGTLHRDVGLFLWEGIHALKLNTGAWFFSPHLNNRRWTASLRQWQLVELKQIGTWQRENPRKCQFWGSDHVVVSVSFEKKIYLDEVQQLAFSNHQGILDLISCNTSAAGLIPPAALENPSHWRYMLFLEKDGNILPAL